MKYRNIEVLMISIGIFMGDKYGNKTQAKKKEIFLKAIRNIRFEYSFSYEFPLYDMIIVYPEVEDDIITDAVKSLLKSFSKSFNNISAILDFNEYVKGIGSCKNLSIDEFDDFCKENGLI